MALKRIKPGPRLSRIVMHNGVAHFAGITALDRCCLRVAAMNLRQAVAELERGDWQAAHEIVQHDEDSRLYCWAHGVAHLMEGDLANARY
jgi:hypothetical protein